MSRADKAASDWAYTQVAKDMHKGIIPADASTLEIAEYSHLAGARALLEWARSKAIAEGWGPPIKEYVKLSDLEAYFEKQPEAESK